MNSIDYFDRGWHLDPQAPCLVDGDSGVVHSYADVRETTLRIANTLHARGFGQGAKAAVFSYNDPMGYSVVLSLMRGGLTWIPINPRNGLEDNAQILERFDCDVLFFQAAFAHALPLIRKAAPRIREYVCIDESCEGVPRLADWMAQVPAQEIEVPHDGERIFAIQATGGTTGFPKGVMLSNRALEAVVAGFMAVAPCAGRPVFLAAAPLTHAAGMVFQHLLAQGGCAVIFPGADRAALLAAIPKHRITHCFLPPTVIYELLAQPGLRDHDYSSLRYFFYGASPMAPEKLRQALLVFGPVMAQIYGQTESGVPNTFLSPSDHFVGGEIAPVQRLASCGRATPFSRVAIMSEDGHLLRVGEVGEIVIRGQGVMSGYYKNPEATLEAGLHGWHHTGDVGYQDAEGYFHIVDRLKDMVISGGFNIFTAEVERALMAHSDVHDCAVIGVPDPKWGEALKAIVIRREGSQLEASTLIAHCKSLIGSMKAPKSVDFVSDLPRSPVGKVLKRVLRKPYWSGTDRRVS